jgi:hypothetical protein
VPASLSHGLYPNIISSRSRIIAGAVIGSIVGCLILFLAVITIVRKSSFLRARLGPRWKQLISAEEKEAGNLAPPRLGNSPSYTSTTLGTALASSLPQTRRKPVDTELLNDDDLHSLGSTDSTLEIAADIAPGRARRARDFGAPLPIGDIEFQLPPVYSSGERSISQSPMSPHEPVPARMGSPRNVGGRLRQWV